MAQVLEGNECASSIEVQAWIDPVVDSLSHDPRSDYVERFWLPVLGPSAVWLLRLFARRLDASKGPGASISLDAVEVARALGLGDRTGPRSPFTRTVERCVTFEMAARRGPDLLAVRTKLPPLARRHLLRLTSSLQAEHDQLARQARDGEVVEAPIAAGRPGACGAPASVGIEQLRPRCRQLALSLVDLGEDLASTERQLLRWRFHPALARECARWAHTQRSRLPTIRIGAHRAPEASSSR